MWTNDRARALILLGTSVFGLGGLGAAGCADDTLLGSDGPAASSSAPPATSSTPPPSASGDSGGAPTSPPSSEGAGAQADGGGSTTKVPATCANAEPPSNGLAIWLRAGKGYHDDGNGNVDSWDDQTGGAAAKAPSDNQRPTLVPDTSLPTLNGVTALHFKGDPQDANQAALQRTVPINGLSAVSMVFVNATDVLWKDDATEWCHYASCNGDKSTQQPGVRQVSETGCSGTYQHVLWWDGLPDPNNPGHSYDWSGVFLSPKQEGIGFRFGNKVETYAQSCCDIPHDENVEYHRPLSIGAKWTETIAVHDNVTNTLYVDGVQAHQLPVPGGKDNKVYANDRLDVGNGFGWVDGHNHGGLVAEVMVYTRALSPDEVKQVDFYLACNLFPARVADAGK